MKNNKSKQIIEKKSFFRRVLGWFWRKKWWVVLIGIVAFGGWYFFWPHADKPGEFITTKITRGDLRQVVTATGEIQPVNTVNVGSQVSGTIDNLYVDFNSTVEKGDVLLTIEPSVLQASVDEARASLDSAISQRDFAKSEYERNKYLFSEDFIFTCTWVS